MSQFFDQASLVMVPSGYKDGKVYSQKPLSTDGELTFSRGSDIEATRVAANGYIEKAKVNLLLQSNTFSTTWTGVDYSITSGQSGYDGSTDAWLFDSSAGYIYQAGLGSISGVHTISVYVKAGTAEAFRIRVDQSTDANYIIDLSDGSLVSQGDTIAYKSTTVGGGWYRMEMAFLANTITNIQFRVSDLTGATSSGTAYIQDAQLNYGLVAQDYVETTTTSVVSGITNDMPRLDYSGGASCPSLKLEPSRQNLFPTDTYLAGTFTFSATTASYNNSISPEGVQNAVLLTQSGTSTADQINYYGLPTTAGDYAYSFFVKAGTSELCRVRVHDSVNDLYETFNPQTITSGTTAGSLGITFEDYGNGWWRASFSRAVASGAAYHRFWFYPDFTNSNGNVSLYGFQCETGSYPTSLIPCNGTSATRTADSASKTGISSLIGQTAGTIFVEFDFQKDIDSAYRISLSDGTTSNRIQLGTFGNEVQVYVQTSGVTQVLALGGTISIGTHKMALAYASNDYVAYLDGSAVITDTSASVPACSKLGYEIPDGTGLFEHPVKQQLLFKTRLSNADLATLTTL